LDQAERSRLFTAYRTHQLCPRHADYLRLIVVRQGARDHALARQSDWVAPHRSLSTVGNYDRHLVGEGWLVIERGARHRRPEGGFWSEPSRYHARTLAEWNAWMAEQVAAEEAEIELFTVAPQSGKTCEPNGTKDSESLSFCTPVLSPAREALPKARQEASGTWRPAMAANWQRLRPHPPVRTVEEQLAFLRSDQAAIPWREAPLMQTIGITRQQRRASERLQAKAARPKRPESYGPPETAGHQVGRQLTAARAIYRRLAAARLAPSVIQEWEGLRDMGPDDDEESEFFARRARIGRAMREAIAGDEVMEELESQGWQRDLRMLRLVSEELSLLALWPDGAPG